MKDFWAALNRIYNMNNTLATAVSDKNHSEKVPRRTLDLLKVFLKVFGPGAIIASLTLGSR